MRIAVVFNNLGPYHVARLSAAAQCCDLLAIEAAARSAEYGWDSAESVPFFRRTLFESENSSDFKRQEYFKRLDYELSAFKPDVLAIPGWNGLDAFQAMRWAQVRSVPVVIMSESQHCDFRRSHFKEWWKARYVQNCQAAIVGGSSHREYLERLGMDPAVIWSGYDVVDNAFFAESADAARAVAVELRNQYGLPERYFLASARFIAKKNLTNLLRAFQLYRQKAESERRASGWDLVLLGDGVLRKELESEVTRSDLSGHVQMPGFQRYEDLPIYYGLAEVFVLPSTTEQWGLVVNEAMASGLPVLVSTRCGCATDLLEEGQNGYSFDPFDVKSLANSMRKIAHESCDNLRMGMVSREIIARWSPQRFGHSLAAAANRALKAPQRATATMDAIMLQALITRFP